MIFCRQFFPPESRPAILFETCARLRHLYQPGLQPQLFGLLIH